MNANVSDRCFCFAVTGAALLFIALTLPSLFLAHNENDEVIYRALAEKLTRAPAGFSIRDTPISAQLPPAQYDYPLFRHPPLFFYLLALIYKYCGAVFGPLLPALAGAAVVVIGACVARRLFSNETGVAAAALLCCCPFLIYDASKLWIETTYTALAAGAFLAFISGYRRRHALCIACAGLVAGLAIVTKYPAAGILPVVAAYALFTRAGAKDTARSLALFFACAALPVIPWLIWHRAVMGDSPLDAQFCFTADYIERFPFVAGNLRHPVWHYLTSLPALAPLYVLGFFTLIRKWRDPGIVTLGVWVICFLGGFSLLGLKLGYAFRYLLPGTVALAILSAESVRSLRSRRLIFAALALLAFHAATGLVNSYAVISADLRPLGQYLAALSAIR